MLVRDLSECKEFIAGDHTILRELLNANKEKLQLGYSLAHAILHPGKKSVPHKLKSSEVYYILQGKGIMHIGEERGEVKEGNAIYIPPNSIQYIENTSSEDLVFLAIVDPAWKQVDEEIIEK